MKNLLSFAILLVFILFSCESQKKESLVVSDQIRLNQVGYYPEATKEFIVADLQAKSFEVIDQDQKTVFSGELADRGTWATSGEKVRMGNFSKLNAPGTYTIVLDGKTSSYSFEIKDDIYEDALKAAIKSYYFQRASMAIDEAHGGIYKRAAGHPDDACLYHPSSGKSDGTLNSPGGWYDAGDYGKYIVNASLTVGEMLLLLEQFPNAIEDGSLNIPESGNGISDLWDELKYELDWILTMQDDDGGVYFKLTALGFGGFIMPEAYDLDRYIIGKVTTSTLDFSAVLAQASRLYKEIDPAWSDKALKASVKAWNWAQKNNDIEFKNPEDVSTGQYGDNEYSDDFFWAASELFLATKELNYKKAMKTYEQEYQHQLADSWMHFVRNVGFHSLLENKDALDPEMASSLTEGHLNLADGILQKINDHPYHIGLDSFVWGSNSDILNQALILCVAHRISGDEKYLHGAEQITDYIFGKNATGYSFMTGFGSKKVMFPHHRPSGADGIKDPVPGFILGGPNNDRQDAHEVDYTSEFAAKAFEDVEPSFASNEVCINWNAPAVYVLGYLQQAHK
ncbi:glycoside hydrolase family 9 protein [Lutimonas sp.]|uniref:glycoside hydrolase family 9 protein n=1 Tax=Lutimonas sp. TaxID=1872403 RepID=UPI003D9B5E49